MTVLNPSRLCLAAAVFLATLSSCSSSRFYNGYTYKGSSQAPDLGGTITPTDEAGRTAADPSATDETITPQATPTETEAASVDINQLLDAEQTPAAVKEMAAKTLAQASQMAADGKRITHQELARELTHTLVQEGKMAPLTARQERKLNRMTAKMDRKMQQQGKEIDWKHNSGLELFFMIMAIGGLVLGIIAIPFGWFVFIVFAGLWLYWKLVKD